MPLWVDCLGILLLRERMHCFDLTITFVGSVRQVHQSVYTFPATPQNLLPSFAYYVGSTGRGNAYRCVRVIKYHKSDERSGGSLMHT